MTCPENLAISYDFCQHGKTREPSTSSLYQTMDVGQTPTERKKKEKK
jgi:hypothetical protein